MRRTLDFLLIGTGAALLLLSMSSAGADEKKCEHWTPLFDGKSLEGWNGAVHSYFVENGLLISKADAGGNLYTDREFGDFHLRFEFRLTPGANNGIGLRVPLGKRASYEGMEIQILDDTAEKYRKLNAYQYHGSVYGIIPAQRGYLKPVGEWNSQEIRLEGRKIRITLNGHVIVDGDLDEATQNGTLDGKNHPGLSRTKGHICLCGHRSRVEFREMKICEFQNP